MRLWDESEDFSSDLLDTMEQSRIKAEPTPYEVYMKVLYELVGHIVDNEEQKMNMKLLKTYINFSLMQ